MAGVTTTQIAAQGARIPSLGTHASAIGWTLGRILKACGGACADLSKAYAQALELAYVKPARIAVERHQLALDADLEGRDPNW